MVQKHLPRLQGPDWHDCVEGEAIPSNRTVISRLVENSDAWEPYRFSKARRRVCNLFQSCSIDDASVVGLLLQISATAPPSSYRDNLLKVLRLEHHDERVAGLLDVLGSSDYTRDSELLKDPYHFSLVHQMYSLVKKYPFGGKVSENAGRAAIASFWEAEEHNRQTNERWESEEPSGYLDTLTSRLVEFFGPCPSWDDVIDNGNWGPGTNREFPLGSSFTGCELKTAVPLTFLSINTQLVPRLLKRHEQWARALEERYEPHCNRGGCAQAVTGSKQSHVSKTALTHRSISTEPLLEGYLQAGLGHFIRRCFKRESRDLSYSWSTCQKLAHLGSVTGIWCTLDLKAASDSTCIKPLVTLMAGDPHLQAWYTKLNRVRCPSGEVFSPVDLQPSLESGSQFIRQTHRFELFSSMGNGYTFELESAIFYCVITSCVPGVWVQHHGQTVLRWPHVSVFGDDCVFPVAYAPQVFATLEWLGYRVNNTKSFVSGPFRESCGLDLVSGVNVRPLFITKELSSGHEIVDLCNRVWARGHFEISGDRFVDCHDSRWLRVWNSLQQSIPRHIRKLILSPPHVLNGLWEWTSGPMRGETPSGTVPSWRVFVRQPTSLDLRRFEIWGDRIWPQKANLSNLLCARLRNLAVPISPFSKEIRAAGEKFVLRETYTTRTGWSS